MTCNGCGAIVQSNVCDYCGGAQHAKIVNEEIGEDFSYEIEELRKKIKFIEGSFAPEGVKLMKIAAAKNEIKKLLDRGD